MKTLAIIVASFWLVTAAAADDPGAGRDNDRERARIPSLAYRHGRERLPERRLVGLRQG